MSRTRQDAEFDLPFYVNGTLSDAERAEIDGWIAEDELLRAELESLSIIRTEMQSEDIRSPGDFGLARLMRDVGRSESAGLAAPVQAPSRSWMWQMVAAIAVVGVVAQGLYQRQTVADAGYELAGAAQAGALVVSFNPAATEADIRALLVGQDLEIVAGPSALGLYRLDVVEGGDLVAATDALRAAASVVESVENALE